ncbi:MAG: PD-(D/E)XK nuclease family protein [Bacteroidales bacterium]|nr:PD-(D/E)XK nuclease family protein [Bacteroidales bacterium]
MDKIRSFLEAVAERIHRDEEQNPGEYCLVFPNRRAGLFIRKYLAAGREKPFFAPAVFSIQDFFSRLGDFEYADHLSLIAVLYETHQACEGKRALPFRDFSGWAEPLIADFNEVDNQMVNAEELFSYLNKTKALDLWSPGKIELSKFETAYLEFYNALAEYYKRFTTLLKEKRTLYPGLAARILAETEPHELAGRAGWKHIVFAGFNALTVAEEKVIRILTEAGKAVTLYDADSYYLDDPVQEAGFFLRKHFDVNTVRSNHLSASPKDVRVIGVAGRTGQAKAAGNILDEWAKKGYSMDETALVLNDESLLIPVLNSIPESVGNFNVTMGFPLKYTPAYHFVLTLFDLHENAAGYAVQYPGRGLRYYHRDILRMISNVYVSDLFRHAPGGAAGMIQKIRESGIIYFEFSEILKTIGDLPPKVSSAFTLLMAGWEGKPAFALRRVREIFSMIRAGCEDSGQPNADDNGKVSAVNLKMEYLYHFHLILNRIENTPGLFDSLDSLSTFRRLLMQLASSSNVPFYGEPLKGLQVMGMLETQTLDFRNIIMLSVNDDLLPAGKMPHSFIPFDIRKDFGLHTHLEKDAIYAYHFYRLLQRAENVCLLYNTEPGLLGGGDPSRFISQMLFEMPSRNAGIRMSEDVLALLPETGPGPESFTIPKSPIIREKLNELATKGLSATSLSAYISCPVHFCLRYLYGIDEEQEPAESVDAPTLGSVVHSVLQQLYTPYLGKSLSLESLSEMKKVVRPCLENAFALLYQSGSMEYGKNFLIFRVAERMISNFLQLESEHIKNGASVTVRFLEYKMENELLITTALTPVKLKGICDRVDEIGGRLRVIDYKTGFVEQRHLGIKEWDDLRKPGFDKAFQLLFYFYLFSRGNVWPEEAGIISLRNLKAGLMTLHLPGRSAPGKDTAGIFEDMISGVITEMFSEVPFVRTDDAKVCSYCPFTGICGR